MFHDAVQVATFSEEESKPEASVFLDDIAISVTLLPGSSDTIYAVETTTSRSQFDSSSYSTLRMLNDFDWLHQKLTEAYPFYVIPPIAKQTLLSFKQGVDESYYLNLFLKRVISHPVLSESVYVHKFLTIKNWELSTLTGEPQNVKFAKFGDVLQKFFLDSAVAPKTSLLYSQWLNLVKLANCVSSLEKQIATSKKDVAEYLALVRTMRLEYVMWSNAETQMNPMLREISNTLNDIESHLLNLAQIINMKVQRPLHELNMCLMEVKSTITRFHTLENYNRRLVGEMQRREAADDGESSESSLTNFTQLLRNFTAPRNTNKSLTQLQTLAFENNELIKTSLSNIEDELERWKIIFKAELKEILLIFSRSQAEFYMNCQKRWENAHSLFENIKSVKSVQPTVMDIVDLNKSSNSSLLNP